MQTRIASLEARVGELTKQVSTHEGEIHKLRLDRQIARYPRWLWTRLVRRFSGAKKPVELAEPPEETPRPTAKRTKRTLAVIVPTYPSAARVYGGQPIERRLRYYRAAGFDVTVVVASRSTEAEADREGIRVVHASPDDLLSVVQDVRPSQVCVHHPVPELWAVAKVMSDRVPVHLWIHGFEARDWRELQFNYTPQEMAEKASQLDAITFDRRQAIREAFIDPSVTKIFVSEFMKGVAEDFAGIPSENSRVIHNVIDSDTFPYVKKSEPDRRHILSIRNFGKRNYATDLVHDTIRLLADEPFFDDLMFSIFGDGQHFEEDTADLRGMPNVSVTRQFLDARGMASAFERHGVLLVPTRWDSQGMTMGEAMSAGLVPVTNGVAAIPEFADMQSAILASPEDAKGLAEGIARLYEEPDLFLSMSANAAERVRSQCGPESTVQIELDLLEESETSRRGP
jgi:glycosyltransferase involved in cell wall biosynthesis